MDDDVLSEWLADEAELVSLAEVEALAGDPARAAHLLAALRRRLKRLTDTVTGDHVLTHLLVATVLRTESQRQNALDSGDTLAATPFE